MNPTPIGWRVQLCTGLALAGMALAAVRVDIINNWEFGKTISPELAVILIIAAACVVLIPTAASVLGWSRHLKATTAICVALTVWSAVNAYSAKQGAAILAAQSAAEKYESAKADEKLARETLNRIQETGDVGELGKLQALAATETAKACRKPRSEACKLAETEEKGLTSRLSDAKARDKAQAILADAKEEAKAGPAEASMVATVLAAQTGADANAVARYIALVLTGFGIAVTQLVALLGGQAASLIGGGIKARTTERAGRAGDAAGEDKATRGTQCAALDRLVALILAAPGGKIISSGRKLAEIEGVAASTYAGWLTKWTEAGLIIAERAGNRTAIKLGKRRAA